MSAIAGRLVVFAAIVFAVAACNSRESVDTVVTESETLPSVPATEIAPVVEQSTNSSSLPGLVLLRDDPDPDAPIAGSIWLAENDGSNARQVTPHGVRAAYTGLVRSKSGGIILYYVSIDGERERSLWSVDVDTGESARFIFSYEDWPKSYQAAVSPDGRYVAHARSDGLYLFDQSTGDTTLLLQGGNELECVNLVFSECERVTPSEWYPDGRKLLIQRLVYEGTWPEVLEPFKFAAAGPQPRRPQLPSHRPCFADRNRRLRLGGLRWAHRTVLDGGAGLDPARTVSRTHRWRPGSCGERRRVCDWASGNDGVSDV
jgi:hypothetical protein